MRRPPRLPLAGTPPVTHRLPTIPSRPNDPAVTPGEPAGDLNEAKSVLVEGTMNKLGCNSRAHIAAWMASSNHQPEREPPDTQG